MSWCTRSRLVDLAVDVGFRERLGGSDILVGTVLSLPEVTLAELVCSPFDFVWIDLEHGAIDTRDIPALAVAAKAAQTAALVRVPSWTSERLPAVVDAGVDGIVAPRVESEAEAKLLVARLRYPPAGSRGFGPRRAGFYGRTPRLWETREAEVACIVQIETAAALAAVVEIAAVDGVDALVVGCADLSFDLGVPQQLDSPAMQEAIELVRGAALAEDKAFGVAASDARSIARLGGEFGLTMAVLSVDVRLYAQAVDEAARSMLEALNPTVPSSR